MADGNLDTDKERVEEERKETPEQNPRNKMFAQIAEAEAEGKTDLVDVADEDHNTLTEVTDGEVVEEKKAEAAPQKFKIKANGVEEELTAEELVKRAELATGADQKFQEAARLRKEAEELRKPAPKEQVSTVDEDDRALARALQMGNEEEAAAVISKIRARPSDNADTQRLIDQRLEFRSATDWFKTEYPDLVQDPNLLQLVLNEDEKLVSAGDKRPYRTRYEQIGNSLRKWRDTLKAPSSVQEKVERKANLKVVPTASVRAAAPKEENDGPSDQEFIAAEARRRGQGFPR